MTTDHPTFSTAEDVDAARRTLEAAVPAGARGALVLLFAELDRRGRIEAAARAWADEPLPMTKDDPWGVNSATPAGDHLLDVLLADEYLRVARANT